MSLDTEQSKIVRFTADIPEHIANKVKANAALSGKTKNNYVAELFNSATVQEGKSVEVRTAS